MGDSPQLATNLKWLKYIKELHPTALFYFSQSYNGTVVLFLYDAHNHRVRCKYAKLEVEQLRTLNDLPGQTEEKYFEFRPLGTDSFMLPGNFGAWSVSCNKAGKFSLKQGTRVLVNASATLDPATREITALHQVFVDTESRSLQQEPVECPPALRGVIAEMSSTMMWDSLASVLR